MKLAPFCAVALAILVSCESHDVVTGHARVSTFNTPAPAAQPVVRQSPARTQPATPAAVQAPEPAPAPKVTASQKQPELKPVQQPAPAATPAPAVRSTPRAAATQIQPKQRVLTPQPAQPTRKKRVLMPGQNRGLMAR